MTANSSKSNRGSIDLNQWRLASDGIQLAPAIRALRGQWGWSNKLRHCDWK